MESYKSFTTQLTTVPQQEPKVENQEEAEDRFVAVKDRVYQIDMKSLKTWLIAAGFQDG